MYIHVIANRDIENTGEIDVTYSAVRNGKFIIEEVAILGDGWVLTSESEFLAQVPVVGEPKNHY